LPQRKALLPKGKDCKRVPFMEKDAINFLICWHALKKLLTSWSFDGVVPLMYLMVQGLLLFLCPKERPCYLKVRNVKELQLWWKML